MLEASYTRALKRYDRDLFCSRNKDGILCVFRKHKRFEPVCVADNFKILNLIVDKQFVCSLTANWTLRTEPRMWGIDHVLSKIREMDLQANEALLEKLDEQNEKVDQAEQRKFRNETEAFLADNRRQFAKAFDESLGLMHSVSKDEPRKRLKDRSIKNGNS
jgi:hypothetical protein